MSELVGRELLVTSMTSAPISSGSCRIPVAVEGVVGPASGADAEPDTDADPDPESDPDADAEPEPEPEPEPDIDELVSPPSSPVGSGCATAVVETSVHASATPASTRRRAVMDTHDRESGRGGGQTRVPPTAGGPRALASGTDDDTQAIGAATATTTGRRTTGSGA